MTYKIIVIDDVRVPATIVSDEIEVILYKTPEEGLAALQAIHAEGGRVDELWLDHDMGINFDTGEDITIMPVVLWMEEQAHGGTPLNVAWIFIHTSNHYRGGVMKQALDRYYPHVALAELLVRDA